MKTRVALITLFAVLFSSHAFSDHHLQGESEFTKPTIDIGCVVSDIDASIKFYTEAIGFKATGGFKVSTGIASDAGLTDNKALDVKVLTLG
ncbi:MAG: bleomycin resistance protein, partial [Planctomycetes bacterium]|nr:bleomycin resistance protein [Planctomycetota bacterium]